MFVKPGGFTYYFLDQKKIEEMHERSHQLQSEAELIPEKEMIDGRMMEVNFIGSNIKSEARPLQPISTYYNYFLGSNPAGWASKARAFESVYYSSLYECIDLKLYSSGDFIKYDFVVAPGADPGQIKWQYSGADEIVASNGGVMAKSPQVSIIEGKPVAFQMINGVKVEVACEYLISNNVISFSFPQGYDDCQELVIDPLLIFSTYSGSTADNWGSSATPGEHGNLYSSGTTNHYPGTSFQGTFPATPGAFQTTYGGIFDVAILKYDSLGEHLLYASYLGGEFSESPHSLVVNKNNELLVLGTTSSFSFPTTPGAFDRTFNGGVFERNVIDYENGSDIFVAKISSDGSKLLASTYLGGAANDGLNPTSSILTANYGDQLRGDILPDADGNIYISSVTSSSDFPVRNSFDSTYNGGITDGIVIKLKPDLTGIIWGTYWGGSAADASHTIKLDHGDGIYVAGGTASSDFPTTANSYQEILAGSADGWIGFMPQDGHRLFGATLTGTPAFDQVYFLDINQYDEVYVYGQTAGSFPVTAGVYRNSNSGQFIQKFTPDISTLLFSTVFGSGRGIPDISPTAFLVNSCNKIYVSGWGGILNTGEGFWPGSSTFGMPLTADAYQKTTSGSDFYFMVLTDDASEFVYGTYLGGTQSKTHVDGGTSRFDKSGVVYHAVCSGCQAFNSSGHSTSDFPTTPTAWSHTNRSRNCNNAAFKFDLSSLKARIQTNNIKLNAPGLTQVCYPDKIVFQNQSTGGEHFDWKLGDGTTLTKYDTSLIIHKYAAPGQYTVKLKAVDSGTCIKSDSTFTIVNVYLAQGVAGADQAICKDVSTQLSASGGVAYEWKTADGTFTSTQASPTVTPAKDTQYYIKITDVNGCIKKDTVKVSVVPGIAFKYDLTQSYGCTSRPLLRVINQTDSLEDTFFDFGDGTTSHEKVVQHEYKQDGTYAFRIAGNKGVCVYDKLQTLPVYTLFIPNVITPGASEGLNDTFKIKYGDQLISQSGVKVSFVVYDRWGVKVYENADYKDNWAAENLSAGTYFYEVKIDGQTTCKNWVQVIK